MKVWDFYPRKTVSSIKVTLIQSFHLNYFLFTAEANSNDLFMQKGYFTKLHKDIRDTDFQTEKLIESTHA